MATLSPTASNPPETPGDAIKELREKRGLSLRRLALLSGVSASALSRWEAQKRTPSIPELEAVLKALEASPKQKRTVLQTISAPRALVRLREIGAGTHLRGIGDLLWALRQRKGWTQTQTARAAHLTQAQIARWEKNDALPKAADLHALCWCLNARAEEIAVLTNPDQGGIFVRRGFTDAPMHWDMRQWDDHIYCLLYYPPPPEVFELFCIVAEQRLIQSLSRHSTAKLFLAEVYAAHARYHMERYQEKQANHWGMRGQALLRQQAFPAKSPTGRATAWFGNVLASAAYFGQSKRPQSVRRAVRLLHNYLPTLSIEDAHYPWAQIALARNLGKLDRIEEAIDIGSAACKKAEIVGPSEGFMRWRDYADILLRLQKPVQALDALNQSRTQRDLSRLNPDANARHRLMEADCFLAMNDPARADEKIREADTYIKTHGLWYLHTERDRLTAFL